MKALGIVCEYNPLHNGHIYHIEQSKTRVNPDVTIAVMSGNYVQRGEPAFIDKYKRAKAALDSSIDLVIELPAYYSLSSAEIFARGAILLLNALKVSSVSFGSECNDIETLELIAGILNNEDDEYKTLLRDNLNGGASFPKARANALIKKTGIDKDILNSSNNILAIEYLKAIKKFNLNITPYTIKRTGAGYNELDTDIDYPSASGLRKYLNENEAFDDFLSNNIPESMYKCITDSYKKSSPVVLDDFTRIFNYKMMDIIAACDFNKELIIKNLCKYNDFNEDLAGKMLSSFNSHTTISGFIANVKSKSYTYTRISRCIMNLILGFTNKTREEFEKTPVPYIKVLGFNSKGKEYLNNIKKELSVPLITKTADYKNLLFRDIHCTDIYNSVVYDKYNTILPDEYHAGIYIKD